MTYVSDELASESLHCEITSKSEIFARSLSRLRSWLLSSLDSLRQSLCSRVTDFAWSLKTVSRAANLVVANSLSTPERFFNTGCFDFQASIHFLYSPALSSLRALTAFKRSVPKEVALAVDSLLLTSEPVQSKTYFACVRQRMQYIFPFFGNKIRQTLDGLFFVAVGGRTRIVQNHQQFLNFESPFN
jgi:hypothetical protein